MTPFLHAAITAMLPHADTDGCAECGFVWPAPASTCLDQIRSAPATFTTLLADHHATAEQTTGWSPSAYVWHVGDVVRAWAERFHAFSVDPSVPWAGFDPDDLARARNYDELPAVSAAWSLARSVDALDRALAPLEVDASFAHPEWGAGTVTDALRWVAHEVVHHELDVRRGLGLA